MKYKAKYRNTIQYKIKMWFLHLTFGDIIKWTKIVVNFILEILITILGFIVVFILPAFFL